MSIIEKMSKIANDGDVVAGEKMIQIRVHSQQSNML